MSSVKFQTAVQLSTPNVLLKSPTNIFIGTVYKCTFSGLSANQTGVPRAVTVVIQITQTYRCSGNFSFTALILTKSATDCTSQSLALELETNSRSSQYAKSRGGVRTCPRCSERVQ